MHVAAHKKEKEKEKHDYYYTTIFIVTLLCGGDV